jgi:hypothetical protein
MAAGFAQGRADIDQRAGTLAISLRNLFDEIDKFGAFLDGMPDNQLQTPPQSYSNSEVAQLKSAFIDLRLLAQVYRGQADVTPAYDFTTFARLLTGVL